MFKRYVLDWIFLNSITFGLFSELKLKNFFFKKRILNLQIISELSFFTCP